MLLDAVVNGAVFLVAFSDCSLLSVSVFLCYFLHCCWILHVDLVSCNFAGFIGVKFHCGFLRISTCKIMLTARGESSDSLFLI